MLNPQDQARADWLTQQLEAHAIRPDGMGVMRVFIEECSTLERSEPIVQGLQQAVSESREWWFQRNAVELRYNPVTDLVTASFERGDVFRPPEQTMPARRFFSLLTEWVAGMAVSEVPTA
jgi:hypothetical protein